MSHLVKIELEINDLSCLKKACKRLGFQFTDNQKTYAWYGRSEKCDHAIKVPDCKYEVGVIKKGTKYELMWDSYSVGGLNNKIGKDGGLLKQAYAVERAKHEAIKKGYSVHECKTEKGVQLRVTVS